MQFSQSSQGSRSWKSQLPVACRPNIILPNRIRFDFSRRTNCCDLSPRCRCLLLRRGDSDSRRLRCGASPLLIKAHSGPFWRGSPAHHGRMFWRRRTKVKFCNYQSLWPVIFKTEGEGREQTGWNITWEEVALHCSIITGQRAFIRSSIIDSLPRTQSRSIKTNDRWEAMFASTTKSRHFGCSGVYKKKHVPRSCCLFYLFI